jgi:3-dehydroquinate dehydratase-2
MTKILILNGPNLNKLGDREPQIYGDLSFEQYFSDLLQKLPHVHLDYFQSNHEGDIIDSIQQSTHQGIVLNAGGFTHSSVAIRDAVSGSKIPVVEVHISNISARESFRHESLISPVCKGVIFGFGMYGYELGVVALLNV